MIPKDVRLYFCFIVVPALLLGYVGVRALRIERERMRDMEAKVDRAFAGQTADALRRYVGDAEASLLHHVRTLPRARLSGELRALAETEPLVRNAFLWRKGEGLVCPAENSATAEERGFMKRYATLFDENASEAAPPPWQRPDAEEGRSVAEAGRTQKISFDYFSRARVARNVAAPEPRSGWKAWFEEDQLFLLGWTELDDDSVADAETVAGVELETAALLSRLPSAFERMHTADYAYRLKDGSGNVVLSFGAVDEGAVFDAIPLTDILPHWSLEYRRVAGSAATEAGSAAFGLLLLAILLVALFGGGAVLVRDARRQRLDALRKTSFVSNVSHELKTPLTSIRMYAELLDEGRVGDAEKARRYLKTIVSESERLSRLVNNVLDFSRLEQGRKKYAAERIDVNAFVADVLAAAEAFLTAQGMRAEFETGRGIFVQADRDALRQVLLNVLDNAGKYAAAGGEVSVSVSAENGEVQICVTDRGPGIAPEHARRIFDKFYRIDTRITAEVGGCGLGLGIARLLMRGMGGDIAWHARAGGGSCFVVSLNEAAVPHLKEK